MNHREHLGLQLLAQRYFSMQPGAVRDPPTFLQADDLLVPHEPRPPAVGLSHRQTAPGSWITTLLSHRVTKTSPRTSIKGLFTHHYSIQTQRRTNHRYRVQYTRRPQRLGLGSPAVQREFLFEVIVPSAVHCVLTSHLNKQQFTTTCNVGPQQLSKRRPECQPP